MILVSMVMLGCSSPDDATVAKDENCGKLISATVSPTTWNEHPKMTVECENFIFVISGTRHAIPKNKDMFLRTMSDNKQYISWDDRETWVRVR